MVTGYRLLSSPFRIFSCCFFLLKLTAVENKEEKISFNETFNRAKEESDTYVIYSNPCFEYWLMLHLNYIDSDLHRHVCQDKVKGICNQKRAERGEHPLHDDDYKSDPDLFEYFGGVAGLKIACDNARKRFEKETERKDNISPKNYSNEYFAAKAPCTNMFELLEALQEYASTHQKS